MTQSKTFIKSGGGYSRIISHIVKLNRGVVIEPNEKNIIIKIIYC